MTVLCGMLEAVKQKLNEVCKQPTAMAAVSVAAIIEMRIQEVTERDPHTNQLYPLLMPEVVSLYVSKCSYKMFFFWYSNRQHIFV